MGSREPTNGAAAMRAVLMLDRVHTYVYGSPVKRGELERRLRELDWYFLKDGGKHAIWAHPKKPHRIYVPRHPTINMNTARAILREATK